MRVLARLLAGLLLASPAAHAVNWFDLDAQGASALGIEVDTDSLRTAGARRTVTVRVSYPASRTHRSGASFRSVVATVEIACDTGLVGYRDATFHAGTHASGAVVAREDGRLAAVPESTRALLPPRGIDLLIHAACARPETAVP